VVTVKTQYNLKNAKEYFEEHLCVGEYYDEGQQVAAARGEGRTGGHLMSMVASQTGMDPKNDFSSRPLVSFFG